MCSWVARRMLRTTSKHYGYDTRYLEMIVKQSPSAFFKFAPVMKAASHREVVPALEAGMPRDQIEAVLRRDPPAMNCATILGFRFADAVVRRSPDDEEYRDAIRAQWGRA